LPTGGLKRGGRLRNDEKKMLPVLLGVEKKKKGENVKCEKEKARPEPKCQRAKEKRKKGTPFATSRLEKHPRT